MSKPIYKLRVPAETASLIRNMHPHLKKKVKAAFRKILTDPDSGKALRDELAGLRSFRVSRFRVIYRTSSGKIIDIIAVGPREQIYEETFRILRRS